MQDLRNIVEELHDQRLVETHFGPHPHDDVFGRIVADRRDDGIDGHDAPDHEGDDHQTEQRQNDAAQYRRYAFNALVQCHADDTAVVGSACVLVYADIFDCKLI